MQHVAKRARNLALFGVNGKIDHQAMSAMIENLRNANIQSKLEAIDSIPKEQLIGTHDGSFHCDEALAVSMLKLLPQYAACTVVRTRNPDLLSRCGIVVDVGAVYDPSAHRYDHHQREFDGVLDGYNTKLSSAGLVYKHFGKDIIRELLKDDKSCSQDFVDICYEKLYKNFIEHVDAIDNGISVADGPAKYYVSTTLSARVGHLNPAWNEPQSIQAAMDDRFTVHEILYALYQDTGGSWRIQAVPEDPQSFQSRKKLPKAWCGLRDEVLSQASGEPGAIFIHASGFIGGHANKQGALNMAVKALSLE
eukprot:GSChrysophyteH1.ASY1.ANO1.2810.1 assembled CDS